MTQFTRCLEETMWDLLTWSNINRHEDYQDPRAIFVFYWIISYLLPATPENKSIHHLHLYSLRMKASSQYIITHHFRDTIRSILCQIIQQKNINWCLTFSIITIATPSVIQIFNLLSEQGDRLSFFLQEQNKYCLYHLSWIRWMRRCPSTACTNTAGQSFTNSNNTLSEHWILENLLQTCGYNKIAM